MKRNLLAGSAVAALCLGLTACGGGGGVGSTPAPTPTPVPTPAPTPTPTPAPAYNTVAQTLAAPGDKTFATVGIKYQNDGSGIYGQQNVHFGTDFKLEYIAASNSYRVTRTGASAISFPVTSGVIVVGGALTTTEYTAANNDKFYLMAPSVNGVELNYTRFASYSSADLSRGYLAAWGVPTIASDVPTTGSATYAVTVAGQLQQEEAFYALTGHSSGSFTANFSTGTVATTLDLSGIKFGDTATKSFGTLSGTASFSSSATGFSGILTGTLTDVPLPNGGGFSGAFFGPGAAEFGYAWYFSGPGLAAQGIAAGKKN